MLRDLPKVIEKLNGPNNDLSPEYKFLTTAYSFFTTVLSASLCHLDQWQKFVVEKKKAFSRSWILVKTMKYLDFFLLQKLSFLKKSFLGIFSSAKVMDSSENHVWLPEHLNGDEHILVIKVSI